MTRRDIEIYNAQRLLIDGQTKVEAERKVAPAVEEKRERFVLS